MDTWQIVLLIAIVLIIVILYSRHVEAVKKKNSSNAGGAALVTAAEKIPVYGTYVKAVASVGKPVNHALDKVNQGITSGLQHIPVVGKYLAMPNQVAGSAVKKVNSWLGLD